MAHNLYLNTMAFTGETPWHRLGTHFEQEFSAAEAIDAAKLGYVVTKEPVYRMLGGIPSEVPGRFVTINNDNQEILGMVGDRYEVVQNRDAFCFFDELMSETGAKFQTAGALGNGERVWLMAKLPESFEPLLGDRVDQFCLLTTSHDASTGVDVRFTPIRVVCQNTLTAAIKGSKETISIRHTASARQHLEQSAMIIKEMRNHFAILGETFKELAAFRIDDEWLDLYTTKLFGAEPKQDAHGITKNLWEKKVKAFDHRLATGMSIDLPGVSGTAWAAYNAAVELADYQEGIFYKKAEDRTQSVLWGRANEFKQDALDFAMALCRR